MPVHISNTDGKNTISGIIGVRYARGCHPDDLWTKYFTSSKHVLRFRKEHGEPDVIEIRQTFNDSLQAREWEEKVLRRLNAVKDERWLNRQNAGKEFFLKEQTEETRRRMSISKKGKKGNRVYSPHSNDTKKKISESLLGKPKSQEHRNKLKEANKKMKHTGRPHTIETRKKMSESRKRFLQTRS